MSSRISQFINLLLYPKKGIAETITGGWSFLNSTPDLEGLNVDVTDTGGFGIIANFKVNGTTAVQIGSLFGLTGFLGPNNGAFFFGNSNAQYYVLLNPATGQIIFNVAAVNLTMSATDLGLGSRTVTTTGSLTNGSVSMTAAHTHLGTAGTGAIIPHVDSAPARAFATTYTNSDNRPLIVFGDFNARDSGAGTGTCYVDCKTDAASPPTTIVQKVGVTSPNMIASSQRNFGFWFVVQPGHRYRIDATATNSSATLGRWREVLF